MLKIAQLGRWVMTKFIEHAYPNCGLAITRDKLESCFDVYIAYGGDLVSDTSRTLIKIIRNCKECRKIEVIFTKLYNYVGFIDNLSVISTMII